MSPDIQLPESAIAAFLTKHHLPSAYRRLIMEHLSPLANWLLKLDAPRRTRLIGINGAQGTGKSTLAALLETHEAAVPPNGLLSLADWVELFVAARPWTDR